MLGLIQTRKQNERLGLFAVDEAGDKAGAEAVVDVYDGDIRGTGI